MTPDLTEDERNVLAAHAASMKVRHLSPSQLAQVNYELQKKGLLVEAGCCGKHDLTQAAVDAMWAEYREASARA